MGSSKEYIPLPTSDKQTPDSPPPYEVNKSPWFRRHWKVTALLATFATLLVIGFSINPCHRKRHREIAVDLGFPRDSQYENLAKQDLSNLMTQLVYRAENGPFDGKPHHHRHHDKHNPDHEYHHPPHPRPEHDEPDHSKMHTHHHPEHNEPDHHKKHPHPEHKKHHHHHPQPEHKKHHHHHPHPERKKHHHPHLEHKKHHHHPEHHHPDDHKHHGDHHRQNKRGQNEEDEVYVQKLPTHNRYHKNPALNRRDEQPQQPHQWKQSYHVSPSADTSLRIKTNQLHESLQGNVTLRQDKTGVEQDIVVTFYTVATDENDEPLPARLVASTHGSSFSLRARTSRMARPGSNQGYSVDILLPSSMKSMKHLEIGINNGTIFVDDSLRLAFGYFELSTYHGVISVEHVTSDRILLGTYSGVISGTLQPTEKLAVGAYYGSSNVRVIQASSLKPADCHSQKGLHIASSSPHGVSTLTLEHNTFKGQFEAQGREIIPNVNFNSNDEETFDYRLVETRASGWFLNDTNTDQLIIHGRDQINLTFE